MNKPLLIMSLASSLLLTACKQQRQAEVDLVLLYTTDVHGSCLHYDIRLDQPARTSLANVCTYVNEQRAAHPDGVMLFDTGDFLQGQPSMYYYNFIDTVSPHIVPLVDNYLGYDAIGVGNHDIETGEAVYHDRLPQQFQMPWLCANAIDQRTGEPMFQPYTVITRQGVKIAILGMITPNIAAWLPKQLWPHLEFQDMVECASQWVPVIQAKEQPDVLVGLFHCGTDYTIEGNDIDTYKNENGGVPAAIKVPGFDIILCGHDHQGNQLTIVNVAGDSIPVLDARTKAATVGRADIHLTLDPKTNRYSKQIATSLVNMNDYAPDSTFCQTFQYAVDSVNAYVDHPLGELSAPLYGEPALYGPSEFIDFIHDVQLWATKADVSLAAVLSPHDTIPAGPITMRQLFTLYKYENMLFTVSMTGAEIQQYLEFGYGRQFGVMQSAADHLLAFRRDAEGRIETNDHGPRVVTPTFNYTCAAGIRYTVDVSQPIGQRVTIHSMSDGTPFDAARQYKVAINSYQASGGGEFVPVGLGWSKEQLDAHIIEASTRDVRRYVSAYITEHHTIVPHLRGDWKVVPEAWWKAGMERDRKFLNPNAR